MFLQNSVSTSPFIASMNLSSTGSIASIHQPKSKSRKYSVFSFKCNQSSLVPYKRTEGMPHSVMHMNSILDLKVSKIAMSLDSVSAIPDVEKLHRITVWRLDPIMSFTFSENWDIITSKFGLRGTSKSIVTFSGTIFSRKCLFWFRCSLNPLNIRIHTISGVNARF